MKFEETKEDFYSEVVATSTLPSDGDAATNMPKNTNSQAMGFLRRKT